MHLQGKIARTFTGNMYKCCLYDCSVPIPFRVEHTNIRDNPKFNKALMNSSDQKVLFVDVVSKVNRKDGKVRSIKQSFITCEGVLEIFSASYYGYYYCF